MNTFGRIAQVLHDRHGIDPTTVQLGSSFEEDLGLDSLDQVELLLALEETFRATISDEEAEKLETVGDAVKLIEAKL